MRKSYCCIFAGLDQSSTAGMGIIKLQSIKYSFFNILAIAIGALGILFIIPLDKESYGQINMLFTAAYLLTPLVGLGLPMVVIKYHGVFIRKQLDAYYLAFTLFFGMVITSVFALLIGIFYDELARFSVYFGIDEAFILRHKFTILLLTILLVLNYVSISFSALHKRIAVPEVLSNVAYKVYIPLIILLIYHQYIPESYLGPLMLFFYGISSLFILLYIGRFKKWQWKLPMSQFSRGEWMGMASFMLQAGVQTLANGMILRLDILMVGLLMGPWYAGMYGIILFMTSTLEIASKAISQISAPIIAENWINGKTEEIGRIYSKSALILTAISCLLFSLLYFNFPYIFSLMPNTNYDASWLTVMVVLSIARIIDLCFSLNGVLLSYSKYNKINIGMLLGSGILYFILIVNLIPKMGMLGAAVSYLMVIILLNLSKYIFIRVKIGLDPVGWGLLQIFGITALTFLINYLLPPFQFILVGIIVHTLLVLMIYMPLLMYFNPSPDITDTIKGVWKKVVRKGR